MLRSSSKHYKCCYTVAALAFSALTLLVGRQEEHPAYPGCPRKEAIKRA